MIRDLILSIFELLFKITDLRTEVEFVHVFDFCVYLSVVLTICGHLKMYTHSSANL